MTCIYVYACVEERKRNGDSGGDCLYIECALRFQHRISIYLCIYMCIKLLYICMLNNPYSGKRKGKKKKENIGILTFDN